MRIHIREASADDAEALAELATQWGYPSQPEEISQRLRCMGSGRSQVFVAVVCASVVGWVHVSLYPTLATDNAAQILGLVVHEEWRGQGIGRALIQAAEAWALESDCRMIYVRTRITRHDAHAFYRQLGYQQVKTSLTFTKPLDGEE